MSTAWQRRLGWRRMSTRPPRVLALISRNSKLWTGRSGGAEPAVHPCRSLCGGGGVNLTSFALAVPPYRQDGRALKCTSHAFAPIHSREYLVPHDNIRLHEPYRQASHRISRDCA